MAEVDPDQEAALRRLRAAFGFVEVLWIVDHHHDDHDQDDQPIEEGGPPAPADRQGQLAGGAAAAHDPLALVRVRPQQLIGGGPVGMPGRGVPLQIPGAKEPLAAAVDGAAHCSQGCPESWRPSSVSGRAWRISRQGMQIRTVNRPWISPIWTLGSAWPYRSRSSLSFRRLAATASRTRGTATRPSRRPGPRSSSSTEFVIRVPSGMASRA